MERRHHGRVGQNFLGLVYLGILAFGWSSKFHRVQKRRAGLVMEVWAAVGVMYGRNGDKMLAGRAGGFL